MQAYLKSYLKTVECLLWEYENKVIADIKQTVYSYFDTVEFGVSK